GWEFSRFHATHKGGDFYAWGRSKDPPRSYVRRTVPGVPSHAGGEEASEAGASPPRLPGRRVEVKVSGRNVLLDGEMEQALKPYPEMQKTWAAFLPSGPVDFDGKVERLPEERPPDLDLTVYPKGCTVRPAFANRYALDDVRGRL